MSDFTDSAVDANGTFNDESCNDKDECESAADACRLDAVVVKHDATCQRKGRQSVEIDIISWLCYEGYPSCSRYLERYLCYSPVVWGCEANTLTSLIQRDQHSGFERPTMKYMERIEMAVWRFKRVVARYLLSARDDEADLTLARQPLYQLGRR
jgi:hypothetical protein